MSTWNWQIWLDEHETAHDAAYFDLLRIASISTDTAHADDVRAGADLTRQSLIEAGVPEVELWQTPGHPVVFGRWAVSPGKPTVLIYGHYDVQPAEPLALWDTPPFEPTVRDGRVFARGSADMKANLLTLIQAVAALTNDGSPPPVNLVFLLEGEEEIGSPNLPELLRTNRERLKADVALSADGGQFGADQPSTTIALKGIAACQVDLVSGSTDLHSGGYGAAVPNAVQALMKLAATFHDTGGKVLVEGFYDDVQPLTDAEREQIATIPAVDQEFIDEAGVSGTWGEPGYSVTERRWTRPTIDFNGVWGGYQGEGTKTVTPCQAHLKITSRLVANQDPERILDLIEAHVQKHAPAHVTVTVHRFAGSARPFLLDPANPTLAVLSRVLAEVYGVTPYFTRSGGSVPVTEMFASELGVPTVTLGFALPGSRAHAPNEWFRLADLARARTTFARFFEALGAS